MLTVTVCAAVPEKFPQGLHKALIRDFVSRASSRFSASELSCLIKHSATHHVAGRSHIQEDFSMHMVQGMKKCIPRMAATRTVVHENIHAEDMEAKVVTRGNTGTCRRGNHFCCVNSSPSSVKFCFKIFCNGRGTCKPKKPPLCNCKSGCHYCCVGASGRIFRDHCFKTYCPKGGKCKRTL